MQKVSLKRIGIIATFLIASVVVLEWKGYISEEIRNRAASLLPGLSSPLSYWEETAGGRVLAWQLIGPTMLSYPLGTGFLAGIGGYADIGGPFQGLHSQYLMLLTGTGIVGTGVFLLFLVSCIRRCLKGRFLEDATSRWLAIGAAGAIVTYFFSALMYSTSHVFGADITLLMICGVGVAAAGSLRSAQGGQYSYLGHPAPKTHPRFL
jgi:O-antigen ligase